jgi:DnaJ homologue, subfamily C, member 28, conserved domain
MTTIEQKIREAIANGAFDNLPGSGAPIDLEGYFQTPEHLRMAYSILKSAGCVPEEVEMVNAVASLERRLAAAPDETAKAPLRTELARARLRLDLALERHRKR